MEDRQFGIMQKEEFLYKYRSLSNPKRFLDILVSQRLYGALFNELNDPMEGYFTYSPDLDLNVRKRLADARRNTRICSFSKRENIGLLWAHYADEYRGCCIKLKVKSNVWERVEVDYTDNRLVPNEKITNIDLFKHKSSPWRYEEEIRYVNYPKMKAQRCSNFLKIHIEAIYMGHKMDNKEFQMWEKVIKKIDSGIDVYKMKSNELDFGFK